MTDENDATDENGTDTLPPAYPFPDDELVFVSTGGALPDFEIGQDSYFAIARLPETETHVFNGREHTNTHRFVIHTPEKGSQAMLVNYGDFENLLALALAGFLDSQADVRTDDADAQLSLEWLALRVGEEPEDIFKEEINE